MCFKNLPVEFDESGRATLKGGIPDPWSVEAARPDVAMTDADREARIQQLMQRQGHIKDHNVDPVTRVAGALAIHMVADLDNGRYVDAHAQGTLFRGYEVIAMGRDPRDAIFLTSRVCGVCGGVHSHCSAYAIEMAMGLAPPPLGTVVRNLAEAAEMLSDNALHLYLLAGPDYSEQIVKTANPELWPKAEAWSCAREQWHGYKTMADIMKALNPVSGELYREGLDISRASREIFVLLHGKYPHPQTVVPGGVSTTFNMTTINECNARLGRVIEGARRMIGVWDDLTEFFYEADERYKQVGQLPVNMADLGFWDDPFAYDATYENCDEWGERRWSTPGVIMDGELLTTRLTDINIGMEEFVEHSYYEQWSGHRYETDPLGNPISPYHQWNKRTLPKPTGKDWKERYTWATTPRWDRQVIEAGAYTRLFITAMAQKQPANDFTEPTGDGMRMLIPKGTVGPELDIDWRIPETWNAFERNRLRAYHFLFSALAGQHAVLNGFRLLKRGENRVAAVSTEGLEKAIPKDERRGVGFWGAGRGWLSHHLTMERGKLVNYQVMTPSTINASPRDPWDQPGAYEQAVMNTPIIEDVSDPQRFTSIDMLRTIRSFDPCMPCTTHVHTDQGTVVREVNTCECGVD
jgi:hydrogenase large subunit